MSTQALTIPGESRPGPQAAAPVWAPWWTWSGVADFGLILAFLATAFLMGCFPVLDIDFWWHLRTGDLIRQTWEIPKVDNYTFTAEGKPWIDLHWGFQVCLSWAYEHLGIEGLNLAKNGVTCLALFLLVTAKKREWPTWVMVLAWLPALVVLSGRMYVRPETLSLLWLSCFLAVLVRWEERPWLAFLLPIVQVCWVNVQGLFVLGPILLGAALVDAALRPGAFAPARRGWWRTIGIASALTFAACLVNPYGIEGALFPLALTRTMGSPIFQRYIAELTPIPLFIERNAGLRNPMLLFHLGTLFLGAMSFVLPILWRGATRVADLVPSEPKAATGKKKGAKSTKRAKNKADAGPGWRLSPFRLLIFAAFSFLSWQATRNSHQFAAVVGTVTAWNFGEWAAAIVARRRAKRRLDPDGEFARAAMPRFAVFTVVGLLFVAVATNSYFKFMGERRVLGLGFEPLWFPHKAIEFAGRPEMPDKLVSLSFGWAALYIYHSGPDRKVFIDPRLEVCGPKLYEHYINLERKITENDRQTRNEPTWPQELEQLGLPIVFVGHAGLTDPGEMGRTAASLLSNPQWRLIYFDPQASIFVHESYADVVDRYQVDLRARHFRPDAGPAPEGSAELLAAAKSLWNYGIGLQDIGRPGLVRAVLPLGMDYARRILRTDPENTEASKSLALLLSNRVMPTQVPIPRYRQPFDPVDDLDEIRATCALRHGLDQRPGDVSLLFGLLLTYKNRGMIEATDPLIDVLIARTPANAWQAGLREELTKARGQNGGSFGPIPAEFRNRDAIESKINEWLAEGRAESVATVIEREFPPEARTWPMADRLATLHLHLGRPDRARAAWSAVAAPPNPALRLARVAVTYLAEGDYDAARKSYREAIALDPDLFEAHYGLAVLETDDGHARAAVEAGREAVRTAAGNEARSAAQILINDAEPYLQP